MRPSDSRSALATLSGPILLLWLAFLTSSPAAAQQGDDAAPPRAPIPEVEVRGTGSSTLLLVGCSSCGWKSWEEFMERNADRYTMVAVTLPGFGGTERPDLPIWNAEPVWQRNAILGLSELLDERDLHDVVAMGHSFGTAIAMRLALERPDRVRALVNLDGSLWSGPVPETSAERLERAHSVREQYMEPLHDVEAWRRINTPSISIHEQQLLHHGMFMATDRISMFQYWWENLLIDRNPEFLSLEMPVLDIQAIRPWTENQDSARAAYVDGLDGVGRPAGHRLVFFPRTRHWIHYERPELFDRVLERFVRGDPFEPVTVVEVPGDGADAG